VRQHRCADEALKCTSIDVLISNEVRKDRYADEALIPPSFFLKTGGKRGCLVFLINYPMQA